MATTHAKNRPPSAAHRWLPCPISAKIVPLYPNDETEASLKGDRWHELMEDQITFGSLPKDVDPDAADAMEDLYAYVKKRVAEGGPGTRVFVEYKLDITETGEFGTGDIIIVAPLGIEVIDEKSGYVPVYVELNDQMLTYLCGAIDAFGSRPEYVLTVHQPNFDHIDGPLRHWPATEADVAEHRRRMLWSVENDDHIQAGPHCKDTYCPHRGSCEAFRVYAMNDLSLGWHTSELKSMSDADLAKALDAADELAGWRAELRTEAMRRIIGKDRRIDGYKMVKARRSRVVRDARGLVIAVREQIGMEWLVRMFDPALAWASTALRDALAMDFPPEYALKYLGTPKHIEDTLKQYARQHNLPRGGWKMLYDNLVGQYIRETSEGLSLERAIDGRPAHKRGSEFGTLENPANAQRTPIIL